MPRGKKFDPDGPGYDYDTAVSAGLVPDKTGHWSSVDPRSGLILKGRGHKTWNKTVKAEGELGNEIYKKEGRYFTRPRLK